MSAIDSSEVMAAAPPSGVAAPALADARLRDRGRSLRVLTSSATARLGLVLLLGFAVVALAAPVLAPCPASQMRRCGEDPYIVPRFGFSNQPRPPSREHPFGTTAKQHDIFYGVVWGTRTAFKVGLLITIPAALIGVAVGSTAGYFGGWVDEGLMRVVELFMLFPFFIAAMTVASVLRSRPDLAQGTLPAMLALLAFGWMGFARIIRSDVLSVKEREYVWAARALGAGHGRIIRRHVIPNAMWPVFVAASLDIGTYVLTFAALSFFGLGVPDGYADWGQMLASARNRIPTLATDWYIVVFPGLALILFALAWTLTGDALRDALDPRMRKGQT